MSLPRYAEGGYGYVRLGRETYSKDEAKSVVDEGRKAKQCAILNQQVAAQLWGDNFTGVFEHNGCQYFVHPKSDSSLSVGVSTNLTSSGCLSKAVNWFAGGSSLISQSIKEQGIELEAENFQELKKTWLVTPCDKCDDSGGLQHNIAACMTNPNVCKGNIGPSQEHARRMRDHCLINVQKFKQEPEGRRAKAMIDKVNSINSKYLPASYRRVGGRLNFNYDPVKVIAQYPKCHLSKKEIKCEEELLLVAFVKYDETRKKFYKQWKYASKTAVRKELSHYRKQSELWKAIDVADSKDFDTELLTKHGENDARLALKDVVRSVDSEQAEPHRSCAYSDNVRTKLGWAHGYTNVEYDNEFEYDNEDAQLESYLLIEPNIAP